jgi:hypothetical protein
MPSPQRRNLPSNAPQAVEAAKWMQQELGRNNGTLTQEQAWNGIREKFGADLAISGETGCWLSKPVLSELRKLTPDVIWDPTGKRWRTQKRRDAVGSGARMLDS